MYRCSLMVLLGLASVGSAGAEPLNVIVITADDLGKQLSCYGDDILETPHMDALAARGIRFDKGYVTQASCSSSRSSILTGTYPHSNGQLGLANHGFKMTPGRPNIVQSLQAAGYQTGIIGKLHVKPVEDFTFDFRRDSLECIRQTRDVVQVADWVDEFVESVDEEPFFLYLNYIDPHVPFIRDVKGYPTTPVSVEDVHAFRFQGIDDPEQLTSIADFYGCIRRLDEGIGLLMERLEARDLVDNTLLVFVGDHGAPFARGKLACYESSLGIPYFVSCPRLIEPGQVSQSLVSTVDIYPTVLDALGLDVPEGVQGESLVSVLKDSTQTVRNVLFGESNFHGGSASGYYPRRSATDGRFKLVLNLPSGYHENGDVIVDYDHAYDFSRAARYDGTWVRELFDRLAEPPRIELFDLRDDPNEKTNLAGNPEYAGVMQRLLSRLTDWMEETDDPFLTVDAVRAKYKMLEEEN
ncbi:sulfatase family protein [Pontiella sulfatireligans]|uniref:sulfatase family protein n=1 Tax=Pontiella sulfatireligans TaxID=2750658 RepID=UPI00144499D1|nr:sulfatase [Pontiella sulfatireligans]